MEKIGRRGFLQLMFGVGAAAALGVRAIEPTQAQTATAGAAAAEAGVKATEAVESELVPTRSFFRRRRHRRVYFGRPRRRRRRIFWFIRRRPRRYRVVRFYRVRRRRRW